MSNGLRIGKKMSSVDVVVLTYGNYTRLRETLESVCNQDYPINTLILSDDGSGIAYPQDILDMMELNNNHIDRKIVRQNEKNTGTVQHLNIVANLCKSEYIKFIGAGDAFAGTDALRKLITFTDENGLMVGTAKSYVCDEMLENIYYEFPRMGQVKLINNREELFESLSRINTISMVTALFHKSFFDKYKGFNTGYNLLEDWPTWLKLARNNEKIGCLDEAICLYSVGGSSSVAGDAYHAKNLRDDMHRCYIEEIVPYMDGFKWYTKRLVQYRISKLSNAEKEDWNMRYIELEIFYSMKRGIKQCLIRAKQLTKKA